MQKLTQIAAALIIGTTLSASVLAAGNTFVTVNGTAVSQNMADVFINEQKAQGAPDSAELKNAVREELVRRELLMQEAKKSGVDKKADVAAQAEAMRQSVIIRAYVQEFTKKNPISDAQLKSQYDAIKAQLGDTEYKARHILVKEEAEAVAVIENLKKGAKFEELAKQSIDPGSKENGGNLDWASPGNFVKPFADALVGLKKGGYSAAPVKSEFGYHVIKLEDARPLKVPSFDEMKHMLQKDAEAMVVEKMVAELRTKAKIQ